MRFHSDYTQTEVANRLGVSQVQVSRMEKRILERLRGWIPANSL
ncbi:DNA-directed RNA polymerase specialized sigma subunit [Chryseomicrobium aureum]|nr:sigma factor-like helix-turn-helix DNA-binding protein [Chryseomicrobium aureum]MBM7705479.1 DNA-directed RNA polymerase specialized sigma subunit [Chryseomicrobium aureum]